MCVSVPPSPFPIVGCAKGVCSQHKARIVLCLSLGISPGFRYESFPANYLRRAQMPSKLYVGNLAYSVSNSDLEELFSQVGQVQSVAVITDKFSGQSKGFGFVEMANAEDASKAIQQFNETELKGRNIKVNEAKPRE